MRQVMSASCLADVLAVSATNVLVNFYYAGQPQWDYGTGLYDTIGLTPFAYCTIGQAGSVSNIVVTAVNDGPPVVYFYTWSDANQGWTLISPDGTWNETHAWDSTALVETNTVKTSAGALVYQTKSYYTNLVAFGQVVVQRVVGTGATALTHCWSYYDNPSTDGTNYGRVKLATEPSGLWRHFDYDTNGLVTREVSQFLNASSSNFDTNVCRVVYYDSVPGIASCQSRVETLLGQEISRQYTIQSPNQITSIQCQTPGAAWNDPGNLVTFTTLSTPRASMASPRASFTQTAPWTSTPTGRRYLSHRHRHVRFA